MTKSTPALGLAALVLVATSACSSSDAEGTAAMEHIHGIGVDPGTGDVYVGTHSGLFHINDGKAVRVADRVQDFMGFTVAGPGHFLASGHPGAGQGGHGSVGLIESTDAGESWHERSLGGEADFHALEYRHDRVYGLNALTGQLLASSDLTTWREVSREPIADFAVNPADPDDLVATTAEGVARSTDGGETFTILDSAPTLMFVGWGEDGSLVGVTPEGVVHASDNPGGKWNRGADLDGRPEALTVQSATEIYAAANGTLLVSTDGGSTFEPLIGK